MVTMAERQHQQHGPMFMANKYLSGIQYLIMREISDSLCNSLVINTGLTDPFIILISVMLSSFCGQITYLFGTYVCQERGLFTVNQFRETIYENETSWQLYLESIEEERKLKVIY